MFAIINTVILDKGFRNFFLSSHKLIYIHTTMYNYISERPEHIGKRPEHNTISFFYGIYLSIYNVFFAISHRLYLKICFY